MLHLWSRFPLCEEAVYRFFKAEDSILDVGCGGNLFKKDFPNLVGIDFVNPAADIITDIQDFTPESQFDGVIAYGILSIGDAGYIESLVDKLDSFLKPGGTMLLRVNKFEYSPDGVDRIIWTDELTKTLFIDRHGYTVLEQATAKPVAEYKERLCDEKTFIALRKKENEL